MRKLLPFFMIALLGIGLLDSLKVISEKPFPPVANTGDPITGNTCARSGCHNGPINAADSTTLTLTIGTGTPTTPLNASFVYTPNAVYNMNFMINAFTGRYGFQMDALTAANHRGGRFNVSNAATEKLTFVPNSGDTIYYIGHLNANSTKNWTYKWTAPAAGAGPITFYYAYNTANGDDDPTGDVIYAGSVTINELPTGVQEIESKLTDLALFPNPFSSDFNLSFNLKENNKVAVELFSLDGKLNRELMNENVSAGFVNKNFDVNQLPGGIYLVKLSVGNAQVVKKVIKL